jgi:hypothetical protein
MLRLPCGESKTKKLAAAVELANAKDTAPNHAPDLHDRKLLRCGLRLEIIYAGRTFPCGQSCTAIAPQPSNLAENLKCEQD